MAFSVNDINNYIQANEDMLIGKSVVGSKTAALLNLQVGVKGTANLNLLTATSGLQDGENCGFSASGNVTVSKRQIKTNILKVNQTFCDKDLVGTSLQWGVKIAAGMETIPFEQNFIDQIIKEINKDVEKIIWQGDVKVTGSTLSLADGFIAILSGETSKIDASLSGKTLSGNTVDVINNIVAKIPDDIIDRPDLVIFVGYDVYRTYIAALQSANNFHFTGELTADMKTVVPGTNIQIIAVPGLTGTNKAYASYLENLYLGTDLENSQEVFDFWYSKDDDLFKLKVSFNIGVNCAYPDLVVYAA